MLLSSVVQFTVMGLASCTVFKTEYLSGTLLGEDINPGYPTNPSNTSMNIRVTEN